MSAVATQSKTKPTLKYYGLDPVKLGPNISQFEIELLYVGMVDPEKNGGLSLMEHRKHVIKMLWPWWWKYWHPWSELCLWAWCTHREIGMTGCAAAHKTFTFTGLSLIEFLAKPMHTAVALTSTTVPSLRGRVWSELMNFMNTSQAGDLERAFGFNVVDSQTKIQSKKGDDKYAIKAVAVDTGDIEKAVGKIQGVHPERMVMMVDEAAQTPPAVFTARANLQAETKFFRFVAIANAVDQFDAHGKFCEPKNGWSTISAQDDHWETRSGICLHFDGLRSPNVQAGSKVYPKLFSQDTIEVIRKNHGENSLEWWSYVRGFWAPRGTRNTVLDAAIIFDSLADQPAQWEGGATSLKASLDPAFTTDGDGCILRFAKFGNFIDGRAGMEFTEIVPIQLQESKDYPVNYQIADRVIGECVDRHVLPEDFVMDSTSASGLADIISQRWSQAINRVNFGGAATDDPISPDDSRPANEIYRNRVTQLWFSINKLVTARRVRNMDSETSKQFCTRQYSLKNEKTILETKKEMKVRTQGNSPDEADSASLLGDLFIRQNGLGDIIPRNVAASQAWTSLVRKRTVRPNYASV